MTADSKVFVAEGSNAYFPYEPKLDDPFSSHATILALIGKGSGRRLLDVGAAHGYLAAKFTAMGFAVTAIEADPCAAAHGAAFCQNMIVADLNKEVPPLTGEFDVLVYGDILEHLREPMNVFRRLNQSLATNGIVVVSVPNVAHLFVRLSLLVGRFEYTDRGILDRTHTRFFTKASFRRFIEESGLKVVKLTATPVPLPLLIPPGFQGTFFRTMHRLNAALARAWKGAFAYQFVAVACREGTQ